MTAWGWKGRIHCLLCEDRKKKRRRGRGNGKFSCRWDSPEKASDL